jgi:hypothetical protein
VGRAEGRRPGTTAYAVALGALSVVWAALAGLAFASPVAALGLAAVGVLTALAGSGWVLLAARQSGVGYVAFTPDDQYAAMIVFVFTLVTVPIVMAMHLWADAGSAWRPALTLLIGLGMTASGVALLM